MLNIFKTFSLTWYEAAVFKVTLASIGILLALYYPKLVKKYKTLWWIVAVVGVVYLMSVWYPQ